MSGTEIIEKIEAASETDIAKWIRNGFFLMACLILNDMRSDIKEGLAGVGTLSTRVSVVEGRMTDNVAFDLRLAGRVETISDQVNKRNNHGNNENY